MRLGVLAGTLALLIVGVQAQPQGGQATQQAIPDAPRPQTKLPNMNTVTPGEGATSTSNSETAPSDATTTPAPPTSSSASPVAADQAPAVEAPAGKGEEAIQTLYMHVDAVNVAFTVKDSKGRLVPGLTARDVQVYENGLLQHIDLFTNEALPMSVALVIDQSMTQDEMTRVNESMGALPDAFTKYDEVSVFTYNKTPKMMTDFTAAQSARLAQAIERSKGAGEEAMLPGSLSGPLAQTTIINDQNFDPNTSAVHNHTGMQLNPPREVHALNDAILLAANSLRNRDIARRRVIYVISDGKEYGSKAKASEVIKVLQTNQIEVDGTLVGDSAVWGLGMLDRIHLPLTMRDNELVAYQKATGGNLDSDFRKSAIEKSFSQVALEARSRYTVGYITHEPFVDGKYRKWEIKVLHPSLTVIAPPGYWPGARAVRPRPATTATPPL